MPVGVVFIWRLLHLIIFKIKYIFNQMEIEMLKVMNSIILKRIN